MNDSDLVKKLVLALLVLGGVGYLAYTWAYEPRMAEVAALEARLAGLREQNRIAQNVMTQDGQTEVERRLILYREQLVQVEGLIPSAEELPDLLDAISSQAQRTGVELTLIQPLGAEAGEFYTRRTYDLAVLGSFHQIGDFLARVGSLPRIVTPTNLNLAIRNPETRSGDPQLEARFAIETYVLPNPTTATSNAVESN
jgi:type IV pilus assembly protein PilO